jgi:5-methylcytosine-specific restriction enzyme subunit McrC
METTIKIKEHSQSETIDLSHREINLIETKCKNKLSVVRPISGDGYKIVSNNYVGVYSIDRYKIYVEPKTPVVSVFQMLCYAYELAFFDDDYAEYENIEDLFEYLISIFQKKVARLTNEGLFANYTNQHDDLRFVKGKINLNKLIKQNCQKNIISCDFDEYVSDVIENQIIKFTIEKLLKIQYRDFAIKRSLTIIQRYFNNISFKEVAINDIAQIQYSVLNLHYKPIHRFCRMILELIGIHENIGAEKFNTYSLDMNVLFERYVGRLLKEELSENDVVLQDYQYLDDDEKIGINPDIVIYLKDSPLLILDTKYKLNSIKSTNDIFQINSYMNKLNANGVLIYPSHEIAAGMFSLSPHKLFVKTINLEYLNNSAAEFVDWVKTQVFN